MTPRSSPDPTAPHDQHSYQVVFFGALLATVVLLGESILAGGCAIATTGSGGTPVSPEDLSEVSGSVLVNEVPAPAEQNVEVELVDETVARLRESLADDDVGLGVFGVNAPHSQKVLAPELRASLLRHIRVGLESGISRSHEGLSLSPPPGRHAVVVGDPQHVFPLVLHPVGDHALRVNIRYPWSSSPSNEEGRLASWVFEIPVDFELFEQLEEILRIPEPKQGHPTIIRDKAHRRSPVQPAIHPAAE